MGKGSAYEREICTLLSRWWTGGKRDDVFWRSSGSGARAKVRGRRGRRTAGQHGDICATDPIGDTLVDLLTIEIKRGYSSSTFQDLVDRRDDSGWQCWEQWIEQAVESHELAGSFSWLLIARRDRRRAISMFPWHLWTSLIECGCVVLEEIPQVHLWVEIRDEKRIGDWHHLALMPLENFLQIVRPEHLKQLAKIA